MRIEELEIYSDASNAAIIRHPQRRFPGVLVQGDTMHSMAEIAKTVSAGLDKETDLFWEMEELRERLESFVQHYIEVLKAEDMKLPFPEPKK